MYLCTKCYMGFTRIATCTAQYIQCAYKCAKCTHIVFDIDIGSFL